MLESYIERETCRAAEANGWIIRKLQWVGRRAAPDRFFAKDGRVVLVEFKRPGEKPRPDQVREIRKLRDAGVEVRVIDNLEDGHAFARS